MSSRYESPVDSQRMVLPINAIPIVPIQPTSHDFKARISWRKKLHGFRGFFVRNARYSDFGTFEKFGHFGSALAFADPEFVHDPEARRFRNHLFVGRETYRGADFSGLYIGRTFIQDAAVEEHHRAK